MSNTNEVIAAATEEATPPEGFTEEMVFNMHLFTNSPNEMKEGILKSVYVGAIQNTLGYGDLLDVKTGAVRPYIVGLAPREDGGPPDVIPLMSLVTGEEAENLRIPDGKGGFLATDGTPYKKKRRSKRRASA